MFGLTYFEEIIAYFWQLLQRAFEKLVIIFFKKEIPNKHLVNIEKHKLPLLNTHIGAVPKSSASCSKIIIIIIYIISLA